MRYYIKQKVFSWSDTYHIYDESENSVYFVEAELFRIGHVLHLYRHDREVGCIRQRLFSFLPVFELEIDGCVVGRMEKKFSFFHPSYSLDCQGWTVEGDLFGWNYSVYSGEKEIMSIGKDVLSWGDAYEIEIVDPEQEILGLMIVLAIDAANCSD